MSARFHHRGQRKNITAGASSSLWPPCVRVLCGQYPFVLIFAALFASFTAGQNQTRRPMPPEKRIHYQIHLALDFENRTYAGTERVRWVNRGDHPTSTVFFHLYPNVRMPGYSPTADKTQPSDEPRLEISEVRAVNSAAPLQFGLDDQETTLRINLHEPVPSNAAVEIELKFKGRVPEIDT